ncbi:hypothetical protein J5O04_08735 [Corynebacterium hindlerae]|uniref:hypothetical protein n=1 Tax=Corynebacterium hindlerae TaxID=699041 RepID=UPI001AD745E6|nr:hypothetical protein [Corynebacterium hindlerae]QTH58908.1 hypothetical protein J5O04_08735 [Corynebacterium hindlerae]
MFFTTVVLALFGVLFLFMGVVSPRGQFLGLDYRHLPGINTPITTASLGAWQAAHRAVAKANIFISGYYFVGLGMVWISGVASELLLMAVMAVGIVMFIPVIAIGNRRAQAFLDLNGYGDSNERG